MRRFSGHVRSASFVCHLAAVLWCSTVHAQVLVHFDLPAQSLAKSLKAIGTATNTDVGFNASQVAGLVAPQLKADLTVDGALARVLVGTGLRSRHLDDHTIVIAPIQLSTSESEKMQLPPAGTSAPVEANDQSTTPPAPADANSTDTAPSSNEQRKGLEEIVVTGTHIAGGPPVGSPLITVTATDIANSGYSTIGDVVRSLPQSFGGGVNPGVVGAVGTANSQNVSSASTVNLRGLGPDSTLTLVDGHRLAYDGFANAVDISALPLAAIERVEILTDGASAVYGSDAVAGVANFILKKDFEGVQASARYGVATRGGAAENQENLLLGTNWNSGNALLNYEHYGQNELYASDRAFSDAAPGPTSLLPYQRRDSAFLSTHQDLSDQISTYLEALYTERKADIAANYGSSPYFNDNTTTFFSAVSGLKVDLRGGWTASIDGDLSAGKDAQSSYYVDGGVPSGTTAIYYGNRTASIETQAGGPLMSLPSGSLQAAGGAGYRSEGYHDDLGDPSATRHLTYGFGELRIPLARADEERIGLERLETSIAGRYEDYSDSGTAATPKVGLLYAPTRDLAVRGSWAKSFRAPSLLEEYGSRQLYVYPGADLGINSPPNAQLLDQEGSNPKLQPERATSWTAGLDYKPQWVPDLKTSITYYNIAYRNRITNPIANVLNALTDPTYAPFVVYNPSLASQAALLSQTTLFQNQSGAPYDPSKVAVLLENQYVNVGSQTLNGVDLTGDYRIRGAFGEVDISGDAAWLTLRQRLTPLSSEQTLSGEVFNPPKFKARLGAAWQRGAWIASSFLNYVASETDNTTLTNIPVASWTTVDAMIGYDASHIDGFLKGVRISASVQNLFDRDPPRIGSASTLIPGLNYDSTNASALGRFVSLTIQKKW
jgi:iron complex outermembrane recepter protein